jgi:hypothetical protein
MNEVLPFPPEENRNFLEALNSIENEELRTMLGEHLAEKARNPVFLLADDKEVTLPLSKAAESQLKSYTEALISWAKTPETPTEGNDGFAFELLTKLVLQEYFAGDASVQVSAAPFSLSFLGQEHTKDYGPRGSIILAKKIEPDKITQPLALLTTSLRKLSQPKFNFFLGVPVWMLTGRIVFKDPTELVYRFGSYPHKKEFIEALAKKAEYPLQSFLAKSFPDSEE